MSKSKHVEVGVIVKPHGLKGHVVVKMETNHALRFQDFKTVFVNHGGSYVPYVVESYANLNKGMAKLQFAGVDNQAEANSLRGVELYQLADLLSIDKQVDLVGFKVKDKKAGEIGTVLSVIESTAQTMLEVEFKDSEIYIPFVEDFLIGVNVSDKSIEMDLPDGMLDL